MGRIEWDIHLPPTTSISAFAFSGIGSGSSKCKVNGAPTKEDGVSSIICLLCRLVIVTFGLGLSEVSSVEVQAVASCTFPKCFLFLPFGLARR